MRIYPTSVGIKCVCGNVFTIRNHEGDELVQDKDRQCHSCLRSYHVHLTRGAPVVTCDGEAVLKFEWAENRHAKGKEV